MKTALIIIFTVITLGILNYGVYQKEQILAKGDVMFLELRPVDPRSLIQGDYMRLRYKLENGLGKKVDSSKGRIVVRKNADGVGEFVRLYTGRTLKSDEKVIRFRKRGTALNIKPDTFLFQEGHRKHYERAVYGAFKFDANSDYLLIGLADKDKKLIAPE